MDGSWGIISQGMIRGASTPKGPQSERHSGGHRLSTGEIITPLAASEDERNVHRMSRKNLWRRLARARKRGDRLSPEELFRKPDKGYRGI